MKSKSSLLETGSNSQIHESGDHLRERPQSTPSSSILSSRPSSSTSNRSTTSEVLDTDNSLLHQFQGLNDNLRGNLGLLAAFLDETQARMKNILGVIKIEKVTMEEVTAAGIDVTNILEDMLSTPSKIEAEETKPIEKSEPENSLLSNDDISISGYVGSKTSSALWCTLRWPKMWSACSRCPCAEEPGGMTG